MKKYFIIILFCFLGFALTWLYIAGSKGQFLKDKIQFKKVVQKTKPFPITATLPKNLKWENGNDLPTFASSKAKKGGVWRGWLPSPTKTIRQVGPESNGWFRSYLDVQDMGLVARHPNLDAYYPSLAKAWAFGKDKRTVYFKLDQDARWSDGEKVKADDFVFMLKFYRSKSLLAPWYNDYYLTQIEDILKIDDYTIAVRLPKAKPDLLFNCNVSPKPYHFYGSLRKVKRKVSKLQAYKHLKYTLQEMGQDIKNFYKKYQGLGPEQRKSLLEKEPKIELEFEDVDKDFVKKYDWVIVPQTGAYQFSNFDKTKYYEFKRLVSWWAKDKKFYKNRYNVDKLIYSVIRDEKLAFNFFRKGKLDAFYMVRPVKWNSWATELTEYDLGYMDKIWYYNDIPRPSSLLSMNLKVEELQDKNIRLGIAYSLNLGKMIKTVLNNEYQRAETISTGYGAYTNKKLRSRRFDIAKANKYFDLAGYTKRDKDGIRTKDGKRLRFELLFGYAGHKARLAVLKEEAKKTGLELELVNIDGNSAFAKMLAKDHQLAWHGWSTGFRPRFWQTYHGDNAKKQTNNFTNLDNQEVNELIKRYRDSLDAEQRIELSKKIQEEIHNLCVAIPTVIVPYFRQVYWHWVKYAKLTKSNGGVNDYGLFWIDEKEKKKILRYKKHGKVYKEPRTIVDETYKVGR